MGWARNYKKVKGLQGFFRRRTLQPFIPYIYSTCKNRSTKSILSMITELTQYSNYN